MCFKGVTDSLINFFSAASFSLSFFSLFRGFWEPRGQLFPFFFHPTYVFLVLSCS